MANDRELMNFGQAHELNSFLVSEGKRETTENRKILKTIGAECKKELGKRVLKHTDLHEFLDKNPKLKKQLEDKK